MTEFGPVVVIDADEAEWQAATHWAGAFLAGFQSAQTRKSYRRDLRCWFDFCAEHRLHPFHGCAAPTWSCTCATWKP